MDKIRSIYLHNLHNNEHFEAMQHVANFVKEYGAEALGVAPQFAAFRSALADEDTALKKILKSALTVRINEADAVRDEIYHGLVNTQRAAMTHFDAAKRAAAERLDVVFGAYKNASRLTHEEETAAIHNLLRDLTEKHADDCEALGLPAWIGELDRRNTAFEKLMEERFEERAGQTDVTMAAARRAVDAAYGTLSDIVFALGLVAEMGTDAALTTKYTELIRRWNEVIDRAQTILARRHASAKKKPDEAAKPEPGTK